MIIEFEQLVSKYNLPVCYKCDKVDFTFGLGENCFFCSEKFNPTVNQLQLYYFLDILKIYFLQINTEKREDFEELKLLLSRIDFTSDNIIEYLFDINKILNRIKILKIRDEGALILSPNPEILLNNEVILNSANNNTLVILGLILLSITVIQNSI
jgi:hypothetical protein